MIIGSGDIANAIVDRKELLFFASGVSKSSETDDLQFAREKNLLLAQDKNSQLVYFSTLSQYYSDSPYIRHKKAMEDIVKLEFSKYTIVRFGNITWGKNPNTLLNHLMNKVINNVPIEIQETHRHIMTKKDFLFWLNHIPIGKSDVMNITGKLLTVREILELVKECHQQHSDFESVFGR